MPRLQNPIKPTFKKLNIRQLNFKPKFQSCHQNNKLEESVHSSGSNKGILIAFFVVFIIGLGSTLFFALPNSDSKITTPEPKAELLTPKATSENVSNTEIKQVNNTAAEVKPEVNKQDEIKTEKPAIEIPEVKKPEVQKTPEFKCLIPNKDFAQNFFEKVSLIEPGIPETLKREMLNTWAMKVAKIALAWQRFSKECQDSQRWGISRRASELADDWNYLADFFSKDVKPEDRTFLRTLVADLISREVMLENQCN